ncbi:NAD(P)H-hydrate dehydratase [Sphingomonas lenta]|uniref:ADP-dependent (S)-NAD(P)H-hydrate dehydratase n=1 Tax=Sphingomonas lenta TaxID=1141887 RepID=A0A2A2SF49_9SPHN|nr:NAD(P)H-hydrate dehydratase [Sphingomonas lenta]PAX07868.1 NAD(P)H-hydrate dehydratase [Sphingomonas lenta]
MVELDAAWRAANPLPQPQGEATKNTRGRVLCVGGARRVPGALRLTAEAALRVGAGKARMVTVPSVALMLGALFPETAVIAVGEDEAGEIALEPAEPLFREVDRTDALVIGPGMIDRQAAGRLVVRVAAEPREKVALLLDAAACAAAGALADELRGYAGRLVLTPHGGEMAELCDCDAADISADPEGKALDVARRYGAVVALKGARTWIAAPDGRVLRYAGGGIGLATGGSGDVLAGVVGGLLARGLPPFEATGWGVWLHGEAGRALAASVGPVGFLAGELLPELPKLLPR